MKRLKNNSGQTLIVLMVFMVVAITVISAAVVVTIVNSQSTSKFSQGEVAFAIAESGAENALMRLLRDPYYAGETLTIGNGTAIINVSGNDASRVVTSTGKNGSYTRKVQVTSSYNNNVLTIVSWKEI